MIAVTTTSGYVTVLDWVNVVLAAIAAVTNFLAGHRGLLVMRPLRYMVGALASLYVALYLWLLLGSVAVAEWSNVVRGIASVAWLVVWIAPAAMGLRVAKRADRQLRGDE